MSSSSAQPHNAGSGSEEYDDSAQGSEAGSTGEDVEPASLSREARGLSNSAGWVEASQRQSATAVTDVTPSSNMRETVNSVNTPTETRGSISAADVGGETRPETRGSISVAGLDGGTRSGGPPSSQSRVQARGIILPDTRSDGGRDTNVILQLSDKEDAVSWVLDRLDEYNSQGWGVVDTSSLCDNPDVSSQDWHGVLSAFVAYFSNRKHQRGVKVDFLARLLSMLTVGTISAYADENGSSTRALSGKWRAIGGSIGRFIKGFSGSQTPKRTSGSGDYVTFARENYSVQAMLRMLQDSTPTRDPRGTGSGESSDDAQAWIDTESPLTPRTSGRVREQGPRRLASDHLRNQDARIQGLEASVSRLEQTAGSAIQRIERAINTLSVSGNVGSGAAPHLRHPDADPFGAAPRHSSSSEDGALRSGHPSDAGVFSVLDRGPRGLAAAISNGMLLSDELAAATNTHQLRQALGEYGEVTSSLPRLTRARHMKMLKFGVGMEILDAAAFRIGQHRSDRFVALADLAYHEVSSVGEPAKDRKAKLKHLYKDMRRIGAVLDSMLDFVADGEEYDMARWRPFEIAARNYVFSWEQLNGNLAADAAEELLYSPVSLTRGILSSAVKDLYTRRAKTSGTAKDP